MLVEDEATPIPCVFWIHGDVCWGKLLAISFVNELMKKKLDQFAVLQYQELIWDHKILDNLVFKNL